MDEKVYQFCGYDYGHFTARDTGEVRNYCTIYCLSRLEPRQGSYCGGFRAEKFKCSAPDVFKDIEPQDSVTLGFDRYGRVTRIERVEKDK